MKSNERSKGDEGGIACFADKVAKAFELNDKYEEAEELKEFAKSMQQEASASCSQVFRTMR